MSNSKRILAALLAGAMVLCAGCGKEEETEEESSNSTAVEVTDVTSGAMSSEYTLNGKIAAVNEVQVFPLLAGQVQTLKRQRRRHRIQGSDPVYGGYLDGYLDDELAAAILQRHKDRDRPCD